MPAMPSVFISHGSPMLALNPGEAGDAWLNLAQGIPKPKAIICVSAHWETDEPAVSVAEDQKTIHDFYGFDPRLWEITYQALGHADQATDVANRIKDAGLSVKQEPDRGLDHGAWIPLMFMYPNADVPVFQLSVQPTKGFDHHFMLGRILAPLRDQGVLIMGSGGLTHNLRDFGKYHREPTGEPLESAELFDHWVSRKVQGQEWDCLMHLDHAPEYHRNHPSNEHILPLLVAAGAARGPGRSFLEKFEYRVLSLKGFIFD